MWQNDLAFCVLEPVFLLDVACTQTSSSKGSWHDALQWPTHHAVLQSETGYRFGSEQFNPCNGQSGCLHIQTGAQTASCFRQQADRGCLLFPFAVVLTIVQAWISAVQKQLRCWHSAAIIHGGGLLRCGNPAKYCLLMLAAELAAELAGRWRQQQRDWHVQQLVYNPVIGFCLARTVLIIWNVLFVIRTWEPRELCNHLKFLGVFLHFRLHGVLDSL